MKDVSYYLEKYHTHALVMIVAIFLSVSIYSAYANSILGDEQAHLNVSYTFLHTGSMISLAQAPYPLHIINVIPVVLLDKSGYYPGKEINQAMEDTQLDLRTIMFLNRLPSILLGLVLMYYIYIWSTRLFNRSAAVFACLIFVLDGNLSGHFHIISVDTTLTTFMFIALYYLWSYLQDWKLKDFIWFNIMLILTIISKISGLYIIIILIAYTFLILLFKKKIRWFKRPHPKDRPEKNYKNAIRYLYILCISFIILFIATFFIYFGFSTMQNMVPKGLEDRAEYKLNVFASSIPLLNKTIIYAYYNVPLPMPAYIKILAQQAVYSFEDNEIYLKGKYSEEGFKYYYIYSFFFKMPTLIIFLTVIFFLLFIFKYSRIKKKFDYWFLIIPILIIWIINSVNAVQLGFKYIFPSLPFLYIIIASTIVLFRGRIFTFLIIFLTIFSACELSYNFHNIIAYQNFVSKSHPLSYYVSGDASLDWGQNGYRLIKYIESNPNITPEKVYLEKNYYLTFQYYNYTYSSKIHQLKDSESIFPSDGQTKYIFITKYRESCIKTPKPCFTWLADENKAKKIHTIEDSIDVYEYKN